MKSILLRGLAVSIALHAPAIAQTEKVGTLQDIQVSGANDLLGNLIKATLQAQPGIPLSSVNLREAEQQTLDTGFFRAATASLKTINGKDVLYMQVIPNAIIAEVVVEGMNFLSGEDFKRSIADLLSIAPDTTLNLQRIEQAKQALTDNYGQEGYPFPPSISSKIERRDEGSVTVKFIVDETAPVRRIEIKGAKLLPAETVAEIFKPVYVSKKFTSNVFFAAARRLQNEYAELGYIQAGVDPRGVSLKDGVLKVNIIEGIVSDVDLNALGLEKDLSHLLKTKLEKPLSLKDLQADVRMLANHTKKPVGFALRPDPLENNKLVVYFGAASVETGPIEQIKIAGNTVVSTKRLLEVLNSKKGDIYSPQLIQDDFLNIRKAYRDAGYEISNREAFHFEDGVLTFNIREVKVKEYKLKWKGKHQTKDRILLREFPKTGKLYNLKEIRGALQSISRLGYVNIIGENIVGDAENPEEVVYTLNVSEVNAGIPVSLGLTYDSLLGGWGGNAGYTNSNMFGLGHNIGIELGAQQNDAGQNWIGNVQYTIPWLDIDFLDFRKERTSLSFGLGSVVAGNSPLLNNDSVRTGRQYTMRRSGVNASVGRNFLPELHGSFGVSLSHRSYFLEPRKGEESSKVTDKKALLLLPKEGLTTRLFNNWSWDNTDDRMFPGRGYRANTGLSYSFGKEGSKNLGWTEAEFGVRAYYGFGPTIERTFGIETYKNAFALRLNYGTILGTTPTGTQYYVGGVNMNPAKELRGVLDNQLVGQNYFTSSLEYRHDFGVSAGMAQGVFGVVFADFGSTWSSQEAAKSAFGVGAGVQLNLGLGGMRFPSLRFDYGFSPHAETGSRGRFGFRLGDFW